ncbi:unnamed protein product, partial [Discosporangium mesarthrocarpum]
GGGGGSSISHITPPMLQLEGGQGEDGGLRFFGSGGMSRRRGMSLGYHPDSSASRALPPAASEYHFSSFVPASSSAEDGAGAAGVEGAAGFDPLTSPPAASSGVFTPVGSSPTPPPLRPQQQAGSLPPQQSLSEVSKKVTTDAIITPTPMPPLPPRPQRLRVLSPPRPPVKTLLKPLPVASPVALLSQIASSCGPPGGPDVPGMCVCAGREVGGQVGAATGGKGVEG